MKIERNFKSTEINWSLLPDFLGKFEAQIPKSSRKHEYDPAFPVSVFGISTFSQRVTIESGNEFKEFLRSTTEQPTLIEACLECYRDPGGIAPYVVRPAYLSFSWSESRVSIKIARVPTSLAIECLEDCEEMLQLEPAEPPSAEQDDGQERQSLERSVFIAHAFDGVGRSYAFQLTKFLSLLGFEVSTGEGYSPEKVSAKVKRRLTAQGIVMAVLSEQQDTTWLTQETTGAEFTEKPIFLLVEDGVEFKPGILSDLEYIRFRSGAITEAFTPILEGLRELGYSLA